MKTMNDREALAWIQAELRKGWQDNIEIPRIKFEDEPRAVTSSEDQRSK